MRRACAATLSLCLALGVLSTALHGCGSRRFGGQWDADVEFAGFESLSASDGVDERARLVSLARVFYERLASRRFNSKATYDDPGLRDYFHSVEAFADYYASLAEALERANFEDFRPTAVRLDRLERTGPGRVDVRVSFQGANALPLRWWWVHLVRNDHWEYVDGRWWMIPGKV